MPQMFAQRWALITGASEGIGEAFARQFAQEGWNVVLAARTESKLRKAASDLEELYHVQTHVICVDLTQQTAPEYVLDCVKSLQINIEALVNNAGCGFSGQFMDVSLEQYRHLVDLNIQAVLGLTHLFLPAMVRQKQGMIINVSSTASFQPLPNSSVYAATKAFVTSLTETLWIETKGTGVKIMNICPGLTKTNFGLYAGGHDFHKISFADKPEEVVKAVFRAMKHQGPTVICGWRNQLAAGLVHILPHALVLELMRLFQVLYVNRINRKQKEKSS